MSAKINKHQRRAERDREQLGIWTTAAARQLTRMVILHLLQKSEQHYCYRCGQPIEIVKNLSIEHKIPWRDSENPRELFFDLDNIAFSHRRCNSAHIRTHTPASIKAWKEQAKDYPAYRHRETGEIIPAGRNLQAMCKKHNLDGAKMRWVAQGKRNHHRGWVLA